MTWPNSGAAPHIPLGRTGACWPRRLLRLTPAEAQTHMHVIGVSGSGKSRFLAGLYLALLRAGYGATLLDPHGDLAALILSQLVAAGDYEREEAFARIRYLDLPAAERQGRYLPLNVLKQPYREDVVAANVKEAFHRAWPELATGAATFDTLLSDSVLLLLHNDLPLTELHALLTNDAFRDGLLARERDPQLVASFRDVYHALRTADRVQYAGSVLRRARQLTQLHAFRYGLSQPELALDVRQVMDAGQAVLVNLATANEEVSALLGAFLMVMAEHAAKSREELEPSARRPHFLLVDEFATFASKDDQALSRMLSQTRKMGVFLVLAHQNWSQTSPRLKGALQNCGLKVAFALDYDDALITSKIIGRVEPKAVREIVDAELSESAGMPEQWQTLIQELQDLPPRHALIRKRLSPLPAPLGWFSKRPPSQLYRVKTVPVPDPPLDRRRLEAVQAHYLAAFFRPGAAVAQQARRAHARRTAPVSRWEAVAVEAET